MNWCTKLLGVAKLHAKYGLGLGEMWVDVSRRGPIGAPERRLVLDWVKCG
jgi:hypothetical protein